MNDAWTFIDLVGLYLVRGLVVALMGVVGVGLLYGLEAALKGLKVAARRAWRGGWRCLPGLHSWREACRCEGDPSSHVWEVHDLCRRCDATRVRFEDMALAEPPSVPTKCGVPVGEKCAGDGGADCESCDRYAGEE